LRGLPLSCRSPQIARLLVQCADEQEWHQTPPFKPVLHRDTTPDPSTLSPLSHLVEALDLLGRAHTLQSQVIEPGDTRAVEVRRDMSMTITSAARRWFGEVVKREDSMGLMIVSPSFVSRRIELMDSKVYIMRMSLLPHLIIHPHPPYNHKAEQAENPADN
jgi:hypothetical protein